MFFFNETATNAERKRARRETVLTVAAILTSVAALAVAGCASQKGKVVDVDSPDRVGSRRAGSEIYDPAAEAAVAGLLARAANAPIAPEETGATVAQLAPDAEVRRICFVGVENAGGEELGDIRESLTETIRGKISRSDQFQTVDKRLTAAALRDNGMRVDDLFLPEKRERFAASLGEADAPFDYLLFAKVTTATTRDNKDSQVKYNLTLDLTNIRTGSTITETVGLKKRYNRSVKAKLQDAF